LEVMGLQVAIAYLLQLQQLAVLVVLILPQVYMVVLVVVHHIIQEQVAVQHKEILAVELATVTQVLLEQTLVIKVLVAVVERVVLAQ
jgi:hypothetical protein